MYQFSLRTNSEKSKEGKSVAKSNASQRIQGIARICHTTNVCWYCNAVGKRYRTHLHGMHERSAFTVTMELCWQQNRSNRNHTNTHKSTIAIGTNNNTDNDDFIFARTHHNIVMLCANCRLAVFSLSFLLSFF